MYTGCKSTQILYIHVHCTCTTYLDMSLEMVVGRETMDQLKNQLTKLLQIKNVTEENYHLSLFLFANTQAVL